MAIDSEHTPPTVSVSLNDPVVQEILSRLGYTKTTETPPAAIIEKANGVAVKLRARIHALQTEGLSCASATRSAWEELSHDPVMGLSEPKQFVA